MKRVDKGAQRDVYLNDPYGHIKSRFTARRVVDRMEEGGSWDINNNRCSAVYCFARPAETRLFVTVTARSRLPARPWHGGGR